MQKRYWSLKDQDSTFTLIQWISSIMPSGRYVGFDYSLLGNTLSLHHNTTGIETVDVNLNSTVKVGMLCTKQGSLIVEDTSISLVLNDNTTNISRVDAVICTHSYSTTVIGGAVAIYSIMQNVNNSTIYGNDQTVLGYLTFPPNSTYSAAVYEQVRTPNVFRDNTIVHTDTVNLLTKYNQFKFQGRELGIAQYDFNDNKIDFYNTQGSFYAVLNFMNTDWNYVVGFKNFDLSGFDTVNNVAVVQLYAYGNYLLDTSSGAYFQGASNAADFIPMANGTMATIMTDFTTFAFVDHAGKVDKNNTNISRGANYSTLGLAVYDAINHTIDIDYKTNHYIVIGQQFSQEALIAGISMPTDLNILRYNITADGFEYVEFTLEFIQGSFFGTLVMGDGGIMINNPQNYFRFVGGDYTRKTGFSSGREIYTIRLIFDPQTGGSMQAKAHIVAYNNGESHHKDPFTISQTVIPTNNLVGFSTNMALYAEYFEGGNATSTIDTVYIPAKKQIKHIDTDYSQLPIGQHRHLHHVLTFTTNASVTAGAVINILDLGAITLPYYSILADISENYAHSSVVASEEMVTMFLGYGVPVYGIAFVYFNAVASSYYLAIRLLKGQYFSAGDELHLPIKYNLA